VVDSLDTANKSKKEELTVDMKGTEEEAANEMGLVGLQLFSLDRYQDCSSNISVYQLG
jgi:hypothetical protein